jgi:WD40 repeat protein
MFKTPEGPRSIDAAFPSPQGDRVFTIDGHGDGVMWDVKAQRSLFSIDGAPASLSDPRLAQTVFDQKGDRIVFIDKAQIAGIYDARTGQKLFALCEKSTSLSRSFQECDIKSEFVAFSPGSEWIANVGLNGVELWSASTLKRTRFIEKWGTKAATFDPTGNRVAIYGEKSSGDYGDDKRYIMVTTVEGASETKTVHPANGPSKEIRTLSLTSDSSRLLFAAQFLGAGVWNGNNGQQLLDASGKEAEAARGGGARRFQETDFVSNAAFVGNSDQVIVWGSTPDVGYIISGEGAITPGVMAGHEGEVNRLSVSANGTLAATTGDDGIARVWDLRHRIEIARFLGHSDNHYLYDIRFMPGDGAIVSAGGDQTSQVWLLPSDGNDLVAQVCNGIPQSKRQFRADELRRWPELKGLADPCAQAEAGEIQRILSNLLSWGIDT